MSKNIIETALPKLRFPDFQGDTEWSKQKLSEILTEHGSRSTGVEEVYSVSVHKGLVNQIEHLGRSYSAANTDNYKRVFPGDIVYTKSPTGDFPLGIIKQSKISKTVIVSPLYGIFTPKTYAIGSILDAYFSSPENANSYLEPIVQKGAKNTINVSNDVFLSNSLFLPNNDEEIERITSFLSSLDDLITAQIKKIEALKLHKNGLMQGLFPAITDVAS
jgi:type I restriction enzyme S subunit